MSAQEMFELMGFKKNKFDYFGLDRFIYKKPIVYEEEYLYTFVVLFDKEELLKALIYDRGQYDKGYEDAMNEVKHPQPLKFEDLKEGMWIYDAPYEEIVRIKEIESNEWIFLECIKSKDLSNTFFQEGRFYPITIPNIGDKNG